MPKVERCEGVGQKRSRKSRDQIHKLQKFFEECKGKPSKIQLKQISKDANLDLK